MYDVLTVYHGGTLEIESPKVDAGRPNLDFGPGFYVTDIYTQAKDWAIKIGKDREQTPIVNVYHLKKKELLSNCSMLIFDSYNKDWLEFVTQSRLGNQPWDGYDYIEGGVADDRVVNTIRLYMTGFISAEEALNRLRYFKPTNQICLLNQEITDRYLSFVESEKYRSNMSEKDRVLHQILTASQTGTIVCRIAKELRISSYEAFRRFFKSNTYAKFRTPGSIMSMLGDPAIVQEFLNE